MNHSSMYKNNCVAIYNAVSTSQRVIKTISGGDRILIELSKYWKGKFQNYSILTCPGGKNVINHYLSDQSNISVSCLNIPPWMYKNIGVLYLVKTILGIWTIFTTQSRHDLIYFSSSDFLPDVLPALLGKIKNKNSRWVAAFYFFASRPFSQEFPYKGFIQSLRGIMYFLTQQVAYFFILRFADHVVLCNELDKKTFVRDGFPADKISCIYGGVDLSLPDSIPQKSTHRYDAIFMARFHPQKGPLEAVEAWKQVIKVIHRARLGIIGTGPEEQTIKDFIRKHNLGKNVQLLGFQDGIEKYKILKSSKLFIHPAIYETGGMAAAEAMAAGLPVVAFDHPGYAFSFPKGMKYVRPVGDTVAFARAVVELLQNDKKRLELAKEARSFARQWDWKKRADDLEEDLLKEGLLHAK